MIGLTPHKEDLRLIGGGHSHIAVIKKLGMHPIPGLRATLISNNTLTSYSGMLPGLIAGHYTFEDCHIDLRKLCQWAGVQFVCSEVQRIDPIARQIYCHQYPSLRYDLLSINVGSQPALNEIKNATVHGHPIKPIKQFLQNWHQWLESAQASRQPKRIVVIGGGAAGVEILLAMHYKLCNTTSIHAGFTLICADQHILSSHNKRVQAFFKHHLQMLGISIICGKHVVSVTEHQLMLNDNTTLNYDFSAWAIHAGAQPWLAESGLKCDGRGFIQIDQYLRSISHPDIFAAGDSAAFMPAPLPKAGVYAVRQGPILAKNIVAQLENRQLLPFKPQRRFLSLLTTGECYAVASRGALFARGKWVWVWKNHIDRTFMARFNPQPMVNTGNSSDANESMRCGGCGAKVSSNILRNVLSQLDIQPHPDVTSGPGDDAAIINLPANTKWLQSVDFFRSFIDDPYLMGRIAAIHSLGDIYAMGGIPHSALVTAVIPYSSEPIMQETLLHLMRGVLKTLNDENTALIGGHSGEGPEMAIGLTVNGILPSSKALTKSGLTPGDSLILTKPIGSGILLAANMAARCQGLWLDQALAYMLQSNRAAATILRSYTAHSCTDVTGFGLLGHLQEMLLASRCSASLSMNAIPVMEGAQQCSLQGIQSTLYAANKQASQCQYYAGQHPSYTLLFDPQTAGGLLAGIPAERIDDCLHALSAAGYTSAHIGSATPYNTNSLITLTDR
ncbi:selenide, water dikinase SelD [Nitrosomonas sp.]|uniref:selenide, water dikinase SelD n=1 Tax=Nitrosomonas sp. TaxID=42353 RepID=UPI0025F447F0|nr:selenide, water dikinase SelD [Nitrosomonas sp.]